MALTPLALACNSSPGPARTERRHPLADEAQTSSLLGFSLSDVLPTGSHTSTLSWKEHESGIEFSPAQSTTELRWSLNLPTSEPLRVEEIEVECDRERFVTNLDLLCEDRLEAGLVMHLESTDGALSEDIAVTFTAQTPTESHWDNGELDFGSFAGSFAISAHQGNPDTLRLGLFADAVGDEFTGALYGDIELSRERLSGGSSVESAVVTVAQWGTPASSR
jgi:hypothetical protein